MMHPNPLLWPVVALVAWSVVILIWMGLARNTQLRGRDIPNGTRGTDLEREMPGKLNWPAHNYNHLMEQPTIFYAILFALILMGSDSPLNLWLAWAYVAIRVIHSLVQVTVNVVRIRGALFGLSSLCLMALTIHAAIFLIHRG